MSRGYKSPRQADDYDFRQHLYFDTNKVRERLSYENSADEIGAMRGAAVDDGMRMLPRTGDRSCSAADPTTWFASGR